MSAPAAAPEPAASPPGRSAVGNLLRATRQRHGLSVADVARALRIRAPYIEAIEEGRPADLPAPAYALGFLRAYAKALALDEDEIVRRFRAEAADLGARTRLDFPAPVPDRGVPAGALAVLGIVIAAAAYGGWWYTSADRQRPAELVLAPPPGPAEGTRMASPAPAIVVPPPSTAPAGPLASLPFVPPAPGNEPLAVIPPVVSPPPPAPGGFASGASPTAAQAAVPPAPPPAAAGPAGPLPEGIFGAALNEESRIAIRARAETWIQVRDRASGTVVFNRTLRPGEAYRVPLRPGLLLTMGNAPGTDVVLDGAVLSNPFPTTSVRRDIPLEPDRVRDGMAAPPVVVRAPATPAAPAPPGALGPQ